MDTYNWETIGGEWVAQRPQRLWRRAHDALNLRLLESWPSSLGRLLKTDLFDEAAADGLLPYLSGSSDSALAIDCALSIAIGARRSCSGSEVTIIGADVERLPFADQSFDTVLSNSTLDHFEQEAQLRSALLELRRVLSDGGELWITMDNMANPLLALRNGLPFRLLRGLGLIPYPMGVSGGPRKLTQFLEQAGFQVLETRAQVHCPRLLAVWVAGVIQRLNSVRLERWFIRAVLAFEALERLPTRYLTGHFVALRACSRR